MDWWRCTWRLPTKSADTRTTLKWLSEPGGTLCIWLSLMTSRWMGWKAALNLARIWLSTGFIAGTPTWVTKFPGILPLTGYTLLTWSKELPWPVKPTRPKSMSEHKFFIDRRRGMDRRLDRDPCKDMPLDLYHRKRRKSTERRNRGRTLEQDYYAFIGQPDPQRRH